MLFRNQTFQDSLVKRGFFREHQIFSLHTEYHSSDMLHGDTSRRKGSSAYTASSPSCFITQTTAKILLDSYVTVIPFRGGRKRSITASKYYI